MNPYKRRIYQGNFDEEEEAAWFYDRMMIFMLGMEAKTNFDYETQHVAEILDDEDLFRNVK